MVLTKDELITALQGEVRIWLHLVSKVDAANLDYRPTPKQRSMLELLQYMTIVGPIHLRAICRSTILRATHCSSSECGIVSKYFDKSASTISVYPWCSSSSTF